MYLNSGKIDTQATIATLIETIRTNQEKIKYDILEVYRTVDQGHEKFLELECLILDKVKQESKEDSSYVVTSESQIKDSNDSFDQNNTSSDTRSVTFSSLQDLSINEKIYDCDIVQSSLSKGRTFITESKCQITSANRLTICPDQRILSKSNAAVSNQETIQYDDNFEGNMNNGMYIEPCYHSCHEVDFKDQINDSNYHDASLSLQDAPMCNEEFQFRCSICGYNCIERIDLAKHMESLHNKKILSCNECAYLTINRTNFRRHTSAHRKGIQQLECN